MSTVECSFVIRDGQDEVIASVNVVSAYGVRFITNLFVAPDHRECGYAKQLLTEVVSVFDRETLYLHALPYADRPRDEEELLLLYQQFGFHIVGTDKGFFPGGMYRKPDV